MNKYLTLKLEQDGTHIYINEKKFLQCAFLLLRRRINEIANLTEIQSVDEMSDYLDHSMEAENYSIPSEVEFWGHCSNIQAWEENNYDSRLLHSNLSFPLLRKLTQVGDMKAKKVYKDEIGMRFASGFIPVIRFLFKEGYIDELTEEEFSVLLDELDYSKLDLNELLRDIYDLQEAEYGYLFLSRIREEFLKTFSEERRYVEIATHHLDKSKYCPIVFTHEEPHFIRGSNDGKLKEFDPFNLKK